MAYRVYLIDAEASIFAAGNFEAASEDEALMIAAMLHHACADAFRDYELWRGIKRIWPPLAEWINQRDFSEQRMRLQQSLADLEMIIENDFKVAKRSQRYATRLAEQRARLPPQDAPEHPTEC